MGRQNGLSERFSTKAINKKGTGSGGAGLCLSGLHGQQRPTLPRRYQRSTIGAEGLNDRGRNGNGWTPLALITEHVCYLHLQHESSCPGPLLPHNTRGVKSLGRLGLVCSTRYRPSTAQPIYLVFSQEPSEGVATLGRAHLEVGFPLRCFQRFSLPHVATQQCPWRNNWSTSGVSIPVLSY